MTRLRTCHLTAAIAIGALAPGSASSQDTGHAGMQMPMTMPMPPEPSPKKKAPPAKPHTDQAGHHKHAAQPSTVPVPTQPSPSASMHMHRETPMDHPEMAHHGSDEPRTPIPPVTDVDRAAAVPPPGDHPVHDNPVENYTVFNRLEGWNAGPGTGMQWEAASWIGTDLNRLWLRTEGEGRDGRLGNADLEVLYGHSVSPWWDVLAGVRHDFKPGASQDFLAFGVQGMAPYKFDIAATGYVGQAGQTSARIEADYELLLTNRLVLQPLVEVNLFGQTDARRGTGAGLSTIEAGLRLRYEITRRFAPYVGVVQERAYGATARLRHTDGEDANETRIVAGVRIWF